MKYYYLLIWMVFSVGQKEVATYDKYGVFKCYSYVKDTIYTGTEHKYFYDYGSMLNFIKEAPSEGKSFVQFIELDSIKK